MQQLGTTMVKMIMAGKKSNKLPDVGCARIGHLEEESDTHYL